MSYSRLQEFTKIYLEVAAKDKQSEEAALLKMVGINDTRDMLNFFLRDDLAIIAAMLEYGFVPNRSEMSLPTRDGHANHWVMLIERGLLTVFSLLLRKGASPSNEDMSAYGTSNENCWFMLLQNATKGRELITNLYSMLEVYPTANDMNARSAPAKPTGWYLAATQMPELFHCMIRQGIVPSREAAVIKQVTIKTYDLNLWTAVLLDCKKNRLVVPLLKMIKAVRPNARDIVDNPMCSEYLSELIFYVSDEQFIALMNDFMVLRIYPSQTGVFNIETVWRRAARLESMQDYEKIKLQLAEADLLYKRMDYLTDRSEKADNLEFQQSVIRLGCNDIKRAYNRCALLLSRDDMHLFYGFLFYIYFQHGKKPLDSTQKEILYMIGRYILPRYMDRNQFNELFAVDNMAIYARFYLENSMDEYQNKFGLFKKHEPRVKSLNRRLKEIENAAGLYEVVTLQVLMAITPGKSFYPSQSNMAFPAEHYKPFESHVSRDIRDQSFKCMLKVGYFLVRQIPPTLEAVAVQVEKNNNKKK